MRELLFYCDSSHRLHVCYLLLSKVVSTNSRAKTWTILM